jgi:hypothetical protein
VLEQVGDVGGEPAGLVEELDEVGLVVVDRREGRVGGIGQGEEVVRGERQLVGESREVAEELCGEVGVVGEERGELLAVHDRAVDRLPEAGAAVGQLAEHGGQLPGVHGLQQRVEVGEHLLQLEAAEGVGQLVTLFQERPGGLVRTGVDVDELLAEERLRADHRAGVGGDLLAVVDLEGDLGVPVDQLDLAHLADVHAADLHVGAWQQALAGRVEAADELVAAVEGAEGALDADGDGTDEEQERDRTGEHVLAAGGELFHGIPTRSGSRCCRRPRR